MHALGLEFYSAAQLSKRPGSVWNCLWGNALKLRSLGSFVRVGYRIPVPDFYIVLHGLRCRKSTIYNNGLNQTKSSLFYITLSQTRTYTNYIFICLCRLTLRLKNLTVIFHLCARIDNCWSFVDNLTS